MKLFIVFIGLWSSFVFAGQSVIEPEMVVIPSGEFMMGGSGENEKPIHKVLIRSFKMSKYETTEKIRTPTLKYD